jgi:DNA-binding transcriptional ArsR family regulator
MVEYAPSLDSVFGSLADSTRRDILQRVAQAELSVGQIAQPYKLTFAAISKHLMVLERAGLIVKYKRGKEHIVRLSPQALTAANEYLEFYRQHLEQRLDSLDIFINKEA